mmetsp:Transcript_8629/g.19351  ORF Transcript_8629/g.19351 Transcript_8629/m.19351 type:complete len:268 (-) Transcript_8629:487-1290(-)
MRTPSARVRSSDFSLGRRRNAVAKAMSADMLHCGIAPMSILEMYRTSLRVFMRLSTRLSLSAAELSNSRRRAGEPGVDHCTCLGVCVCAGPYSWRVHLSTTSSAMASLHSPSTTDTLCADACATSSRRRRRILREAGRNLSGVRRTFTRREALRSASVPCSLCPCAPIPRCPCVGPCDMRLFCSTRPLASTADPLMRTVLPTFSARPAEKAFALSVRVSTPKYASRTASTARKAASAGSALSREEWLLRHSRAQSFARMPARAVRGR